MFGMPWFVWAIIIWIVFACVLALGIVRIIRIGQGPRDDDN